MPSYTWVRLAQRVPVRMRIEHVPPGVPLVSGMTATVSIRDAAAAPGPWWRRKLDGVETALGTLIHRPVPRADCVPAIGDLEGRTTTLPTPVPAAARRADQINPGHRARDGALAASELRGRPVHHDRGPTARPCVRRPRGGGQPARGGTGIPVDCDEVRPFPASPRVKHARWPQ